MKNVFFFEKHPPLGKQLIAGAAYFAGYDGNFTFSRIGSEYSAVIIMFANSKSLEESKLCDFYCL
jgi:dolichyl-phosphate-mannose-protein mannosyltransferase